jgi:glucosamine-6-phosphate isomerase
MIVTVHDDYAAMSETAANFVIDFVKNKPDALLCFAGGDTPLGTYERLVQSAKAGAVDFGSCRFVGLDEWVGMDKDDFGSCQQTLYTKLFTPLQIDESKISFFDAKADDLAKECRRIDNFIHANGKIDLMILGVGVNGHLGFNEPGVSFDLYSHVIDLDQTTKSVGQKYFNEEKLLTQGITLGIKHILNADTVIVMANGKKKAAAVNGMIKGEVSNQLPASVLQQHNRCFVHVDREAAADGLL